MHLLLLQIPDRDPGNMYGYGIISANGLADALTNPATITISPGVA